MENSNRHICVSGPSITQKEIDYVCDAVKNAWYENANLYNTRFERAFAEYIGVKHAISLPSCTSALHLSLLSLGIGPGDEVIVPEITWIATAAPIEYVGATPVFADVDEKSWCLSAKSFERNISVRTKAVIPVDLYGSLPDMDSIISIAKRNNIAVIEDAAEAMGSRYNSKKAGCFGIIGAFSFHGSKTMTTGEGGMLVTDDDGIFERCLILRDHGRDPGSKMFWNTEVAYKYKMSSLQAALGLAQLERIEELVQKKREIFSWYKEQIGNFPGIKLNNETEEIKNSFWMVTIIWDDTYKISKENMVGALKEKNIDSRPFFYPLSSLPAYGKYNVAGESINPTSYSITKRAVNLPCGMNMDQRSVKRVCNTVKTILESSR